MPLQPTWSSCQTSMRSRAQRPSKGRTVPTAALMARAASVEKGFGRIWLHSARHSTRSRTDKRPSTVVVEGCGTASSQATPSSSFETTCSRSTGSIRSLPRDHPLLACPHLPQATRHSCYCRVSEHARTHRAESDRVGAAIRIGRCADSIYYALAAGGTVWLPQGSKGTTCANQTFAGGYQPVVAHV